MSLSISFILFYTGLGAAQVQLPVVPDLLTELTEDITQLAEEGVKVLEFVVARDAPAVVSLKPPTRTAANKPPVEVQAVHALTSKLTALPTHL